MIFFSFSIMYPFAFEYFHALLLYVIKILHLFSISITILWDCVCVIYMNQALNFQHSFHNPLFQILRQRFLKLWLVHVFVYEDFMLHVISND
jgi:hypothetical protein